MFINTTSQKNISFSTPPRLNFNNDLFMIDHIGGEDLNNTKIEDLKNLMIKEHRAEDQGYKPKVKDQATKNAEFGK